MSEQNSPEQKKLEIVEEEEETEMDTKGKEEERPTEEMDKNEEERPTEEMDKNEEERPTEEMEGPKIDGKGQGEDGKRTKGQSKSDKTEGQSKSDKLPSPMEADNGQIDDGGAAISDKEEKQQRKEEDQIEAMSAKERESPSGEVIETSQSDFAQPPLEKTPPKLRIHRVFRSAEGVEVVSSAEGAKMAFSRKNIHSLLKMRMLCSREQLWRFAFDDGDSERVGPGQNFLKIFTISKNF